MTPLPLGDAWLTIEGVLEVASGRRAVGLSRDPAFRERIARGALFLKQTLDQGGTVYGVNTGYGDSCVVEIPPHLVTELPVHPCAITAAARASSSTKRNPRGPGRAPVLAGARLLRRALGAPPAPRGAHQSPHPAVHPGRGLGRSERRPDAALLCRRDADRRARGELPRQRAARRRGAAARRASFPELAPKEVSRSWNDTAVMTGLAALAWSRAEYLSRLAARLTATGPVI